jgi:hypothetical protein
MDSTLCNIVTLGFTKVQQSINNATIMELQIALRKVFEFLIFMKILVHIGYYNYILMILVRITLTLVSNLCMKEGSLFCSVVMRSIEMLQINSWCLWKALNEEGCMGLVP